MYKLILKIYPGLNTYGFKHYLFRIEWYFLSFLFRITPRHLYFIRNILLRISGAKIGKNVKIYPSVVITDPINLTLGDRVNIGWNVCLYCIGKVSIDNDTTISQYTHISAGTHDINDNFRVIKSNIYIGSNVWIAYGAFVGSGKKDIKIEDNAVLGAKCVVMTNVSKNAVVAGNPAKLLRYRDFYL